MSNRLKELRDRKAKLFTEAEGLAALDAEGKIDAEQTKRYSEILDAEMPAVNASISREERLSEERRTMEPAAILNADTDAERLARQPGNQQQAQKFASLGEQMLAVARAAQPGAQRDPRLLYQNGVFTGGGVQGAATGMNESIGSDGGFLVQTEFQSELLQNVWDGGEILKRIRKIGIGPNANGLKMNGVDETSRVNGSRWGGIISYWTPEAGEKTASQPKFRRIEMELAKLTGLCYATDELLQDAVALEAWLKQAFEDEFTFKIEDAIINGTGNGMPLGILSSGAVVSVAKGVSQAGVTIIAGNILDMWMRLPPKSRKNAVWLVNVDTEAQLANIHTVIKNVAGTENVGGIASVGVSFMPAGTNGNEFAMLMGRPVIPVEFAATLGTVGDIILADLSQYLGIDKGPMQTASSIHVKFTTDQTCYRFVYRFNGMPIWRSAVTPYKGSSTLSPFIVLATRS